MAEAYSLVGFQNHLRYGEQARVLRLIPGMERGGVSAVWSDSSQYVHLLTACAQTNFADADRPEVFFAGQITGVEGYVESVAMGWLAGVNAARLASSEALVEAPRRDLSARPLCCKRRDKKFSASKYYLCPVAPAG